MERSPRPMPMCRSTHLKTSIYSSYRSGYFGRRRARTKFTDVWCLWDTGAKITKILGSQLNADVKGGPDAPEQGFLVNGQLTMRFGR